ncbi:MAG: DUF814 domain-containing protein [Spartobacteria bacterium]|nr:DUF814 domain-containing protein [Spartobacteria bacterium]
MDADVTTYYIDGVWEVLVGRTDRDNDILSLRMARPNDWWFHINGMPGSHVVLRCHDREPPTRDILEQAAAIAAYHSKARAGGRAAVHGTLAKHVSKPPKAKPGTVHIKNERTFKVKPMLPTNL